MSEEKIEKRKKIVLDWIKEPSNATLIAILILAFAIRMYYFPTIKGQPLWWDEAEYMATAKHWAFGVIYNLNGQRPPLFQALAALAFKLGLQEAAMRILLVIIPSVILSFTIYLLGKEMFDKKIALIAAFLSSISWTFVFWSLRLQPDFFSMIFQVLAVFFMWKYWKEENKKMILPALSGLCVALGVYFKVSALLVPMIFIVFIFLKERLSAFFNKANYVFSISFLISMVPYFIWSYFTFHDVLALRGGYTPDRTALEFAIGWYNFRFYYFLTEGVVFILFLIGLILALKFLFYSDLLLKEKKHWLNADIFCVLSLAFVSAFYIFYIRNTDDRWVFLWMPFIFLLAGKGLMFIYDKSKKYSKPLAILIIAVLLALSGYYQYKHFDSIIETKKDSYMPTKLSGIWLKENANKNDRVLSAGYTQTVYYSEINVTHLTGDYATQASFDGFLQNTTPRYVILSALEYNPPGALEWVQNNQNRVTPVQAYFSDAEKKNPILIIYEIKY
ncbi:MAG: glycosyltransferase family 39 protein [Nanoarchaeota archaeon]|nr:glycosyltransferase family 39 protein [Nanoarchaeota archaeon]